jgi:hypothetical protein
VCKIKRLRELHEIVDSWRSGCDCLGAGLCNGRKQEGDGMWSTTYNGWTIAIDIVADRDVKRYELIGRIRRIDNRLKLQTFALVETLRGNGIVLAEYKRFSESVVRKLRDTVDLELINQIEMRCRQTIDAYNKGATNV